MENLTLVFEGKGDATVVVTDDSGNSGGAGGAVGGGTPSPGLLSTLKPGFARNIGSFVGPGIGPGGGAGEPNLRTGFSGLALDEANLRLLFGTGGGHGGHGMLNDILALELKTLVWSSLYPPTELDEMIPANATPAMTWKVPGKDEKPTQRHLYNGNVVVGGKMWMLANTNSDVMLMGDGSFYSPPEPTHQNVCGYDIATGKWVWSQHVGVIGNHYSCGAAEYKGKAIVITPWSDCWLFDPDLANPTPATGLPFAAGFGTPSIVFYPPNGKYYSIHIDNRPPEYGAWRWTVYEIDMEARTSKLFETVNTPTDMTYSYPSFSYDSVSHDIGGLVGGANGGDSKYFRLKPETRTWSTETMQPEAGSSGIPRQEFFCGARDILSGCQIFLADGNTWAYRPSA